MATLVLSAADQAAGGYVGGSVLGLSMATIGRAAGAALGRAIDQRLLGSGSEPVEVGRVDRLRLSGSGEGGAIPQVYGRMRVPGQVIWASSYTETSSESGGGKGGTPEPEVTEYSYHVSLAVALCEGQITRVGRIWADGVEVPRDGLNMRVYEGTADQLPDPKIAAIEGIDKVSAYRGTAYVVFEDMPLGRFGNRVPQFTFEVMRPAVDELADLVKGVALIPGTGEYSLATTHAYQSPSYGTQVAVNTNSPLGGTDFSASMDALTAEHPKCGSAVVVVSWFGDDLRCGQCEIAPKVEQKDVDADAMPWSVAGRSRKRARLVPRQAGKPVYGGTPADAAVVEAIVDMKRRGVKPVFYPFILMEQLPGNDLPNPWNGENGQPALPWRGRITSVADGAAEVAAFMGQAAVADFSVDGRKVRYSGPSEWRYRRFILHYAALCQAAGGVDAFCIGSEMRGLTQIRDAGGGFPAVDALRALAADVRAILGPDCKISYAADWSEYHGFQPAGTGDKFFHLDPLWADPNIDFIGIDNYMPLADWRDGDDHRDAGAGSIYDLDYLQSNIEGGEGYDWFYHSPEARAAQIRTPITDGDEEPWVWRYKDLPGWWGNYHHNRVNGVRAETPTAWEPQSKPIWFTEFGCAAIDKGANQPNKFLDPKSSESRLPHHSNGARDDFMQMQYIRAMQSYYEDAAHNPTSAEYDGRMVDADRMHVWAWDARPYPFFPANQALWSDGDNYARGHWLNGRGSNRSLASVVAEICERSGMVRYDVSRLYGIVRGYHVAQVSSARSALQPLMLTYGFDAVERDGRLVFETRDGKPDHVLDMDALALDPQEDRAFGLTRASAAEVVERVQFAHLDVDDDYQVAVAEASQSDRVSFGVAQTEYPLALTRQEARNVAARWQAEARVAQDQLTFALPPSSLQVGAGDVVAFETPDHRGLYRIDRLEEAGLRLAEARRVDPEVYRPLVTDADPVKPLDYVAPTPVEALFLDLPLLTGDEVPHAPFVAATAAPWPGPVALYSSDRDSDYTVDRVIRAPATIGVTLGDLQRGPTGLWDRQALRLRLVSGALRSASVDAVLSGANALAIGDGSAGRWEVLQFVDAVPVDAQTYDLTGLLRGQAGSDGMMPNVWPAGSRIVLLNRVPRQIDLPAGKRGQAQHFRYGPASRPLGDTSHRYAQFTFEGNGLRPYPVVHLKATRDAGGVDLRWIRRTRIDGDLWSAGDVPLGEEAEQYLVRIIQDGAVRREVQVDTPAWRYDLADVGADPFLVQVAQVSARFGPGPFTEKVVR